MRVYRWLPVAVMLAIVTQAPVHADEAGRIFPLYSEIVGDLPLPLPFGIGVTVHRQDQGYEIVKANRLEPVGLDLSQIPGLAGIPGIESIQSLDLSLIPGLEIDIDNELLVANARIDAWVLPFLNLFLMAGTVEGETVVDVTAAAPVAIDLSIPIEYAGFVYGAGATAAWGWKQYFGFLTYTYTDTKLDDSASAMSAWVLAPRLGIVGDRGALWIGAMYQEAEETQRGTKDVQIPLPVTIEYDVELKQRDDWNILAGVHTTIGDRWDLELEAGFGDRRQASLTATYRF